MWTNQTDWMLNIIWIDSKWRKKMMFDFCVACEKWLNQHFTLLMLHRYGAGHMIIVTSHSNVINRVIATVAILNSIYWFNDCPRPLYHNNL